LPGVAPVGFDPVARLLGKQGGSDDPAGIALLRQGTREPVATGTSCGDEDELLALRPPRSDQLSDITLPGPDRAEGEDLGALCWGDLGDRHRLFVNIQSDIKRARLVHG
jgi:hypothetical protein